VQRDRYKEYKRVKGFLRDADWREVEPRLSRELQEKSLKEWLRICLDKGMKDTVRKVVLGKKPPSCWELPEEDADLLVDGLSRDYPEEVMEHYWSKARGRIQWGHQRGSYREAARFLGKAKDIQVRVLKDGAGWTKRISALREEHVRRRALIEELRGL
jgi:hypothetical protein